jgi:hypothetical protein
MPTNAGADGQHHAQHRIGAAAARQIEGQRHEHQQHELLAVGEADLRIAREARRQQREAGVDEQRPEESRRRQPFAARDVRGQPRQRRHRQQNLRGSDRQLHRRDNADQRPQSDLLESIARWHARGQ